MGVVLCILIVGGLVWFFGPAAYSMLNLHRRNVQVRGLTSQSIRDMNKATKKQNRIW